MQNKKIYIVLIVIILGFFLFMFFTFGAKNIIENDRKATFIIGENTVWTYDKLQWKNVHINEMPSLNWQEYELYIDNQKIGDYYLWHDDKWYAFDQEKNPLTINGNLLAFQTNYNIGVASFTEEEMTNTLYAANVLKKYDISLSSKLTVSKKVSFDMDQDGIVEDFYMISNAFSIEEEPNKVFSFAFMVKNEQIYMMFEDVRTNSFYDACKPFINSFIDIDKDNRYEVLLGCGNYSIEEQKNVLYQFDNQFKVLISNDK